MGKIRQTLIKIKEDIKPLLVEMFPHLEKQIQFAYEDDFQEWFGMLFDLKSWSMSSSTIGIEKFAKDSLADIRGYEGLKDFGYISVVLIEGDYQLVDGYHRVLVASQRGLLQLEGVVWEKKLNDHHNCEKIKQLIIDNL